MTRLWKIIIIRTAIGAALAAALVFAVLPVVSIASEKSRIQQNTDDVSSANVAIVFGAGITVKNTPSDVLNDRLKVAAGLYHAGKVRRILVSGDNRFEGYSEPDVMRRALTSAYGVPAEAIHADYAGRRTYDTCIRAHELWGIDRAILVTQDFHLPRALWTCRKLGIDGTGVSASLQGYVKDRLFRQREIFAAYKAFIDVYLVRPAYIGGDFVEDLD